MSTDVYVLARRIGILGLFKQPTIDKALETVDSVQPVKLGAGTSMTGLRQGTMAVIWYATVMLRVIVASPKKFAAAIDKQA